MPGKPGLPAKLGVRVFDNDATRELYLSKIREKHGRDEAARLVGVAPSTVWRYVKANPAFLEEIQEAEAAKIEAAHTFWFTVMNDEEAPLKDRLKASELLERTFGRDNKRDAKVEHVHRIEITGDQRDRVNELTQRVRQEADTIEGRVIEERDSHDQ